jgi:hypothetical protein
MATQAQIDVFLGLNKNADGATGLLFGEALDMSNYRITDNNKLKVIDGYAQLFDSLGSHPIRGIWHGELNGVDQFIFACNGHIYRKYDLSGTIFDSLDTSTYTNVDVVKTTALNGAEAGSTGIDNVVILKNNSGDQLTEVAAASVDLVESVGKFFFDSDEKISVIVAKGAYANIAAARVALGTYTSYYRIGALTDAGTDFFIMDNAIYILNGAKYYKWTGTGSIAEVVGYRPCVATGAPPTGGGTLLENINLLTGAKYMKFVGTASATEYFLSEQNVDSVDYVKVNEVLKTVTTDYTVNLSLGKVTLVVGSTAGDIVEVGWTKLAVGDRDVVQFNKHHSFLGSNNERVFLWGVKNTRVHSGLPIDGSTSAEYFESGSDDNIGPGESITGMIGHADRQLIWTTTRAYYSYEEKITIENVELTTFPVKEINETKGNVAPGQERLIVNNPFTVYKGVYEWTESEFKDRRNANIISKRVQPDLDEADLKTAVTFDYEILGEYWLCVGPVAWVYKYRNDVWYRFDLDDTPTCFAEIDGYLYFGTANGQVMKFDPNVDVINKSTFNGAPISRSWEMGFYAGEDATRRKNTNFVYIGMKPEQRAGAYVNFATDKNGRGMTSAKKITYNLSTFEHTDFEHFSFKTNYNPQPFAIMINAILYSYIKFKIFNESSAEKETILFLNFPINWGGKVR